MESRIYLTSLYDIYGTLLTDKQRKYFENYYFDNLSLSEISENEEISRNGVHKHINDAKEKLEYYEQELKIYERNKKIIEFSKKLDKNLQEELEELI